jgi:Icc-related predicted phosphoesterase
MRVFALSDIHIDFAVNARWIDNLSAADYTADVLILAGDVTDILKSLEWCLGLLAARFRKVLFVPGNHDLWVTRDPQEKTSLQKFDQIAAVADSTGVAMSPLHWDGLSIYPLLGWYDYSFGEPSGLLKAAWMDYRACRWPSGFDERRITEHFAALNEAHILRSGCAPTDHSNQTVITFSHFLPRKDIIPPSRRVPPGLLDPVLGSAGLDHQLRRCRPKLHVFGHSHVNRSLTIDGVTYINNAFGYPDETLRTAKRLLCVHEC